MKKRDQPIKLYQISDNNNHDTENISAFTYISSQGLESVMLLRNINEQTQIGVALPNFPKEPSPKEGFLDLVRNSYISNGKEFQTSTPHQMIGMHYTFIYELRLSKMIKYNAEC